LAISGDSLYVGGAFTTAGSVAASNIARWDGSNWFALGSGIGGPAGPNEPHGVRALAISGPDLYAGGFFDSAGGAPASNIARWNGSAWSPLSQGLNGGVSTLVISGTALYAGGYFSSASGLPAQRIARWNGSAWSSLGSGIRTTSASAPSVDALALVGPELYVGGLFDRAGERISVNIACWGCPSAAPPPPAPPPIFVSLIKH
jgi:hypothetical protein